MVEDDGYDIVIRDPEGGILDRWIINEDGRPCRGSGVVIPDYALYNNITFTVQEDRRARKDQA